MSNTHSLDLELSSSQYAYITDANQTGLDITGDITIELWIKLEQLPSTGTNLMRLVNKWTTTGSQRSYNFYINVADGLSFLASPDGSFTTGNTFQQQSVGGVFVAGDVGNWVYIAMTWDASEKALKFYKNTTLQSNDTVIDNNATSIYSGTGTFYIGASLGTANFYDGLIDEIRISNVVRDVTYISTNYNTEITLDANHVGYWKFNNSALDETSNNNDLTLVNSPTYSTDVPFSGASTALAGTITSSCTETDIVNGGKTIILTLTGDTWVTSGATFDAQRQNIINGIDSAQSEATGWDAEVKGKMAVTEVVRTSDTVVTITLAAQTGYNITATETITATIPATALTGNAALIASPTFTITAVSAGTVIHHLGLLGVGK